MARRRDERSRLARTLEFGLYALAVALPATYFASRYPPFDVWLGRIELRNPIVVGSPTTADESGAVAEQAAAEARSSRVYRCENAGQIVLSDRPCGNVVETREIGPGDMNILPSEAFTGRPAVPENVDCEQLRRELDELDAERRADAVDAVTLKRDEAWQRGRTAACW